MSFQYASSSAPVANARAATARPAPPRGLHHRRAIADPALALASRRINGRGKRVLDLVLGALILAFTAPLLIAVWVGLRMRGAAPALTGEPRIGRRGKSFILLSFNVDRGREGRASRLANFLRATGLARLPALANVLMGDMSLVGPPPVDSQTLDRFSAQRRYYLVTRPGLTAPWRSGDVRALHPPSLWRDYVLNWRLRLDLGVLGAVLLAGAWPRAQ